MFVGGGGQEHERPGGERSRSIGCVGQAEWVHAANEVMAEHKDDARGAQLRWLCGSQRDCKPAPFLKGQRVVGFPCKRIGLINIIMR